MEPLDWWAKENIRMDRLAKDHWKRTHCNPVPNQRFKHEKWSIWFQGEKLAKFTKDLVHEKIAEETSKGYWMDHKEHVVTEEAWDDINWKACKEALSKSSMGRR